MNQLLDLQEVPKKLLSDLGVIHCSKESDQVYQRIKRFVELRNGLRQEVAHVPDSLLAVYNLRINEYEDSILELASRVGANHE